MALCSFAVTILRYSIVLAIFGFNYIAFRPVLTVFPCNSANNQETSYGGSNLTKLKAFKLVERNTPLLLLPNFIAIGYIKVFINKQIVTMPVYGQDALNICHPHHSCLYSCPIHLDLFSYPPCSLSCVIFSKCLANRLSS